MSSKGMLLASETLKMVVALISLTFLIYLLVSIYYTTTAEKEKEQAMETIRRISEVESRLSSSQVLSEEVNALTPPGWMVFSFTGGEVKPNSCAGENCLCLCEELNSFSKLFKTQQEECAEEGVCSIIPELLRFKEFEIKSPKNPTSIKISKLKNGVFIEEI